MYHFSDLERILWPRQAMLRHMPCLWSTVTNWRHHLSSRKGSLQIWSTKPFLEIGKLGSTHPPLSKFNSTHTLFLHLSLLPFPSFPYNYCHSHLDSNLTLRREELQDLRPSPRDPRASWKRGCRQWNHPCQVINYKMGVLTNQTKLVTDPQLTMFKILADNTYICVSE